MLKNYRFGLQLGLVVLAVATLAIPLANLLVAESHSDANLNQSAFAVQTSQEELVDGSSSAVSALMAGNVVGGRRGCSFGLRRPASAFVP